MAFSSCCIVSFCCIISTHLYTPHCLIILNHHWGNNTELFLTLDLQMTAGLTQTSDVFGFSERTAEEKVKVKRGCFLFSPPLSSCLISRLACVVVNWFTMSRAVWLRVFLTPALIPLWIWRGQVQERSCRKQNTEVIIDFLVPNIQCHCWFVCVCTRQCACVGAPGFAQTRSVLQLRHNIKIHRKGDKETKVGTGL